MPEERLSAAKALSEAIRIAHEGLQKDPDDEWLKNFLDKVGQLAQRAATRYLERENARLAEIASEGVGWRKCPAKIKDRINGRS